MHPLPPPPLSVGGGGGEPPSKFSKREGEGGLSRTSIFRGGDFFQGGILTKNLVTFQRWDGVKDEKC